MLQRTIYKISFSLLLILVPNMFFLCNVGFANNASYITLSNQMARKRQLEVVANNVANAETIGFQQDEVLLRSAKNKKTSKKGNSFVFAETT